ncbi:MAG: gliding motility-associated C-terminal domain-containing protein [Bacteroidetes bacterium]|nr:gliding motility-associated C-terminal domain-containing protein [Bacteroidota bacterium]
MRTFIFIISTFLITNVLAQAPCQGPGGTASTAQAVCGTLVFHQDNLQNCTGQNIPNPTAGCGNIVSSDNAYWYKFHCYQGGKLGFLLVPRSLSDDYDWEIMDITGHDPNDVYTQELRVSLNLSGITGSTGCTPAGAGNIHCAGGVSGSQYNSMPTIQTGHDYLLMVNNYSQSGLGYDLSFSGTAVLTNNQPPTITNVATSGCDATKLRVTFSDDILCTSITANGSEFTITGGATTMTGVTSDCALGANGVSYLTINFSTPIPPGNYQLSVHDGDDGNTFDNVCELYMLPATIPFTVPPVGAVTVSSVTSTGCAPTMLDMHLSRPVWCSSIAPDGSEISIMPGNIPFTSITPVCSGATPYADLIHINLQNPLPFGTYQLVIHNGNDGDTYIDTCGNTMSAASFPFTINQVTNVPYIASVDFNECHPKEVVVNFDHPISCATIDGTASEFSISPGVWPVSAVNYTCAPAGNYTTQVTIQLLNPLPAGNFAVSINAGSDGNTVSDTCALFIAPGYNKTFVTTAATAPKFDSAVVSNCNPSTVRLYYNHPIQCSTISADGSEFTITGPSGVSVTGSVTNTTCASGYSNWIELQLAQPIAVAGNYTVHVKSGTDGNGIIDTCNAAQSLAETISFPVYTKPSAAFTSVVHFGCVMDTVVLSHAGGDGINTWLWIFDDGTTATGQTATHLFPVSTVSTSIQLVVANSFCGDSVRNTVILDNAFNAAFTMSVTDTACINSAVTFTNTSTGNNLQYLWQMGDNTQYTVATPSPHAYATAGLVNVQLIATDAYGCKDTAAQGLYITPLPSVDFTGLQPQYCTDKTITLQKVTSNTISSYTWDNGDGLQVQNKPQFQFSYAKEKTYTITLTANDKYCTGVGVAKTVDIFAVPQFSLGNDTVLCPAASLQIGVPFNNSYTYLWSTGATTPQITTDLVTANYTLTIDNHGCTASDQIEVKVLGACIIAMPNAFTPNHDGNNDVLRATNADLAKEFSLKIYNRYGVLLFSTTNPLQGWDGTYKGVKAETGTYVWQLSYMNPWNNKKVFESGTSILLR